MALNGKSTCILILFKERKVFSKSESVTSIKVLFGNIFPFFIFLMITAPRQYTGYVLCCFCKYALKHDRITSETTHLRDRVTNC